MCFDNASRWIDPATFHSIIIPNGLSTFVPIHTAGQFTKDMIKSSSTNSLGDFTYNVKVMDTPYQKIMWDITIVAHQVGNKYQGSFTCTYNVKTKQTYAINGDLVNNDYFFPKYSS